jgi:PAS domain S-box-containing protein
MNFIDMRTVVLSLAATGFICALVLGLLYGHNRRRYAGLGLWLAAFSLQSAGLALILVRGSLPDTLSIGVANITGMAGLLLFYFGLNKFWDRAYGKALPTGLFLVFSVVHSYFTFVDPSLPARIINLNLVLALFYALCARAVYSGAPALRRAMARFPAVVLVLFSLVGLTRAALAVFGHPAVEFFRSGAADTSLVFAFQLLTVALTFSLFLMVNRRILADARADFEGRVEAERALHGALKVARLGTWSWDIKANLLSGSEEMYSIFGMGRDNFTGNLAEVMARVIHPDDKALVEAANKAMTERGLPEAIEYRVLLPDGGIRWVHGEASELVKDEAGRPARLKGYAQDITGRKEAEERVRESAGRLELAVSSAGMGLWQWDIKSDRRAFDAKVCELLGIDREKFTGRAEEFFAVVHTEDAAALKAAQRHAVETDTLYHPEYRAVWPDGSVHYISSRGRLRRDEKGEPWLLDGLLWDITDRKTAEAAIQSAQRLESLGSLAGGIAHDFNNLLTGISANLSLLRDKVRPEGELPELVGEAEVACRAARNLARQLLTFSSGGEPLRKPLDLGKLVRESVEFSLRGSGARAEFSGGEGIFSLADRDQVFQAAQNLAMNAAQAMGGTGLVKVETAALDLPSAVVPGLAAGRYAAVAVRDSGPGIPPQIMDRIFEPYFSTKGTGRGLGLAVCRSIAVRHGGQITVATGPGGTVFTMYLPLTEERPEVSNRRAAPAAAGAVRGRVLVMDDEEIVYKALARMLRELGYETEITTDGDMALAAWKAARESGKPFNAAIMDLTISGGMGGVEAMRRLREMDPAARAIVSSGYSEDPVLASYRDYGFSGVLPKPFRLDDLARAMEELPAA